jgi:hypothetical protein
MIRHTILFKAKSSSSIPEIKTAINDFLELRHKLPGIISIMGGECHFQENAIKARATMVFTHAISIDFENEKSLQTFFTDSITHPAKNQIVAIVEGGYDAIIGFEIFS